MSFAESPLQGAEPGAWTGRYANQGKGLWSMAGFTLLEVLVGAAVLSVALLAMAAMFPTGYTNITEAGKMTMARRLRYALAGEGDGFTFKKDEKDQWTILSSGSATLNGRGQVGVAALSATLNQVTVTITYPGRSARVQLVTNITRL